MKPSVVFTRSDGAVLAIDDTLLGLTGLEGIGSAGVEIFSEKRAVGQGDVITGKRVTSRLITVKASARVHGRNAQIRKAVSAFFNSMHTYEAVFHYDGISRTAEACELKAMDMPTGNIYKPLTLTLSLLCPGGYLQGGGLNGQNINEVRGGFGFPYVSLVGYGFNTGVFLFAREVPVQNDGAAPSYLRAVLTCRGPVKNPKLMKDGAFIRILTTLEKGDVLEIDTFQRAIRLNGKNAITLLDRASSFSGMTLEVGKSVIGFEADENDTLLDVSVYWHKQYETL